MMYKDCRDAIKSGDLLAFTHTSWKSWNDLKIHAVRLLQESEYYHVGIAMVFGGRVWVLEAVHPVVRVVPLSNLLPVYWSHVDVEWTPEVEEYCFRQVGITTYSDIRAILAYLGFKNSFKGIECAELVKDVYTQCGLNLECRAIPASVVHAIQQTGSGLILLE